MDTATSSSELTLDESALHSVRTSLDQGAITPAYGPHRDAIVKLLNDDESNNLKTMVRVNLIAERIAVEAYRQMIALLADKDPATRRMLEDILADEEKHADELKDWLEL